MSAAADGLAGAAGAVIATVVTYPLNTISTVQAVTGDRPSNNYNNGSKSKLQILLEEIRQIIDERGLKGLYNGIRPAIIGAALSQGVYFFFYSALRDLLLLHSKSPEPQSSISLPSTPSLGVGASLAVASMAGSINVILTNPIWILATRMQAGPKSAGRQSVFGAVRELYRSEGSKWIFKGLVPALVMVSNPTVQYTIYEWLMKRIQKNSLKRKQSKKTAATAAEIFLASAAAKIGATLVTYPLLLIKNRLQVGGHSGDEKFRYEGTIDAARCIFREEGFFGFYKGMGARMLASVLAAALLLMIKEKLAEEAKAILSLKKS
ncbi:hypothetical protein BSKO_09406 [Bryopsis sp. KO-2023]|nr:hypothetical protein BSKO_09406 [Bryopsis sp. KO-2023]